MPTFTLQCRRLVHKRVVSRFPSPNMYKPPSRGKGIAYHVAPILWILFCCEISPMHFQMKSENTARAVILFSCPAVECKTTLGLTGGPFPARNRPNGGGARSKHKEVITLMTVTRNLFSSSSCMAPLMEPMAQQSVFRFLQDHSVPFTWLWSFSVMMRSVSA